MFGRKKDKGGAAAGPATLTAAPVAPGAPTAPVAAAPAVAMLLLREAIDLQAEHVVAWWAHLFPGVPGPTDPVVTPGADGASIAFRLPTGGSAQVTVVGAPAPGLGGGDEWTYLWPDFDASAAGAHAVVVVPPQATPVETLSVLTRLLVSVGSATTALGVLWGAAAQVERFDLFSDLASSSFAGGGLPVALWVSTQTMSYDGRSSAATVGMTQFGLMDLEIIDSPRPAQEVFDYASSLVSHLVQHGQVFADGETVGGDPSAPIVVRHAASEAARDALVQRLEGY